MKKYLAELIGTYALVLFGTGAIVIHDQFPDTVSHLGIAISFGAVVTAMIYSFGRISGAHINPSVSLAFRLNNKISTRGTVAYIAFQVVGAILASLTLAISFPQHELLGTTLPAGSTMQSFFLELILTFFLMLGILTVSESKHSYLTGLVVGIIVMLEALVFGPVTGASMNPARSIGPAMVSGHLEHLWIYIFAPTLGAILAIKISELLT